VREAAVPLWTECRCIVRKELRSPLGVRVGRTTLSMVVGVQCKCNWRVRAESEPSHWSLAAPVSITWHTN
jgi:hypothetical protein